MIIVDNNYLDRTRELLNGYNPISLSEMDKVRLMDRMDSKFVLSFKDMIPLLESLSDHYFILTIGKNRVFSYRTDYFDTPELEMFSDHHNGKLNRYKIRQREYIESDTRFLEVKFKTNKGRIIKERIQKNKEGIYNFRDFIHQFTPYNPDILDVTLVNRFNRFTLVDKKMQERVTVDLNLSFSGYNQIVGLNGLVIIEVKQDKNSRESHIFGLLKEKGIRPESFSKYCLGIALLSRHNKFNNFKRTINLINKLSHVEISA